MGPYFLGFVLALSATCNGASFPRVRRQGSGELVKTIELDGALIKLKLKDASQPLNGGSLSLEIQDLRKYSPMKSVAISIELERSVSSFNIIGKYAFEHSNSKDYERGEIKVVGSWPGGRGPPGGYSLLFKTVTGPGLPVNPVVPREFSEMVLELKTNKFTFYEQMKSTFTYINAYKNRNIESNIIIDPFKSVTFEVINGANTHNIEFRLLTSFGDIEESFNLNITGSLFGEAITGSMEKVEEKLKLNIRDLIMVETIIKMEQGMDIWKTDYSISKSKMKGHLEIKYEDNCLKLVHEKLNAPVKNSLVIKVAPGEGLDIEETIIGSGNEETVMTYKTKQTTKRTADVLELNLDTEMTLDKKSKISWIGPLLGITNQRTSKIRIFVDKKNSTLFSPKFKIEAKVLINGTPTDTILADTTNYPWKFSIDSPDMWKQWGVNQPSVDVTVYYRPWHVLDIDANVLGGLNVDLRMKPSLRDKTIVVMDLVVKKGDAIIFIL